LLVQTVRPLPRFPYCISFCFRIYAAVFSFFFKFGLACVSPQPFFVSTPPPYEELPSASYSRQLPYNMGSGTDIVTISSDKLITQLAPRSICTLCYRLKLFRRTLILQKVRNRPDNTIPPFCEEDPPFSLCGHPPIPPHSGLRLSPLLVESIPLFFSELWMVPPAPLFLCKKRLFPFSLFRPLFPTRSFQVVSTFSLSPGKGQIESPFFSSFLNSVSSPPVRCWKL